MRLALFAAGTAICGALIAPMANAGPAPILEEVLVTYSTRQLAELSTLPYQLHSRNQEQLQQSLTRSLPEALSDIPGVLVQKTANGHGSPFIRGFTGYRTLTLIDGVRYNNSVYRDGPNEYFSLIDFHSLSTIELLSGPASALYGSDAIGGTINLQTIDTAYQDYAEHTAFWQATLNMRGASAEDSLQHHLSFVAGKGQHYGVRISYTDKQFGNVDAAELGELANTGYDEQAYDIRFDRQLSTQWQLTGLHQKLAQNDVWRTHSTIYGQSFAGTQVGSDLRRLKDQQRSLSYAKLHSDTLNGVLQHATLTLSRQQWQERGDRIRSEGTRLLEDFDTQMWGIDLSLGSDWAGISWNYGVDYYVDFVTSARQDISPNGDITPRIQGPIGDAARYSQLGIFWQAVVPAGNGNLHIGHRYSAVDANIGRYEDPVTHQATSYQQSWQHSVFSLRLQQALDAKEHWQAWLGVSQAFRAPNIADLSRFGASRSDETEVAATALEPEEFLNSEVGLRVNQAWGNASATVFHTTISNFISSTPTGRLIDGLTEVTKQNASNGAVYGAELHLAMHLPHNFKLSSGISWLRGELDQRNNIDGAIQRLPMSRIAPLNGFLQLRQQLGEQRYWWSIAIQRNQQATRLSPADRNDTQRIPPDGTPAYTHIDIRGGMTVMEGLTLTLGINNVLDSAYRSHGSGSNEPGLGLTAGLQWQLGN